MSQIREPKKKKTKDHVSRIITYSVRYFLLQKWFYDGKNAFEYSRFIHYMDCFYPNGEAILWGKGRRCQNMWGIHRQSTACLPPLNLLQAPKSVWLVCFSWPPQSQLKWRLTRKISLRETVCLRAQSWANKWRAAPLVANRTKWDKKQSLCSWIWQTSDLQDWCYQRVFLRTVLGVMQKNVPRQVGRFESSTLWSRTGFLSCRTVICKCVLTKGTS